MTGSTHPAPNVGSRVFVSHVRVRFHEIDALGHVNNAAYLNYLEQAAIDHASALGLEMTILRQHGGVFVAHRHDIVFLRPAFAGDVLRITTWLGEASGARVNRHYRVERVERGNGTATFAGAIVPFTAESEAKERIVRAVTEWVFVSELGQPRRIPGSVIETFARGDAVVSDGQSGDRARPGDHRRGH